jgi:1,5-anhydro-D-fructose reductase (1,5-anhydro-D-mannitol-forming)
VPSPALRLGLATLEHDHAWWTLDHIMAAEGVELVGVVDPDSVRCARARAILPPGTIIRPDLDDLLGSARLDGLVITAPNSEHRSLVERAAALGVACMVQKPMATTGGDAGAMAELSREGGLVLMVNHFPLWQPAKAELFRRVIGGEIGEIREAWFRNGHQGPAGIGVLTLDYQRWLYDPRRHGGGALMDQATYGIAYAVWLLGTPERVRATETFVRRHALGVDDISSVTLEYAGAQVHVSGSWAWPHRIESIDIAGSAGRLRLIDGELDRLGPTATIEEAPSVMPAPQAGSTTVLSRNGVEHFAGVLRGEFEISEPHSAVHNVLVCRVTDAALLSARTGSAVPVS